MQRRAEFLKRRKELLQNFVKEIGLSDKTLIETFGHKFKALYPSKPGGVTNFFFTLKSEGDHFGYHFEEALFIRHHLLELLTGDLWELCCDFGVSEDFPYSGICRRTLEEISRSPPKSKL